MQSRVLPSAQGHEETKPARAALDITDVSKHVSSGTSTGNHLACFAGRRENAKIGSAQNHVGDEMKIDRLSVTNFRGISNLEAPNLGDTVIIAGQNGSGKSCIFDAIRLLKSTYGGYQQNEWQNFFGEFAIQLHGGAKHLKGLFNDSSRDLRIECEFKLRAREKQFLASNLADLLEETIWQTLLPEAFQWGGYQKALFANQFRERQPEVTARVNSELPIVQNELNSSTIIGRVTVKPSGQVELSATRLLSVIFTNYKPREIGVIDFHGAQRHYGRENVQGINLTLDQNTQNQSAHSLYNYNNKYNNVKSEMAGGYVRELLAKASGKGLADTESLSETLKELFEVFFPEKRFLGPQPTSDGSLAFPVVTPSGSEHDLDELSSGEKEILYGYLRIRSSAPQDSIILLDEPELHLNPRLIRGLPEFYRKHLGEALQNQIWMVTHSDALIREAVGKQGFNVFHMLPCSAAGAEQNQLKPLTMSQDLERVLADLVGDLAAYRPGGKGLIFEGGGDSDFDKTMTAQLFQEELRGLNLISGSNKARVRHLHEILDRAYNKGDLPTKFYAITDDDGEKETSKAVTRFRWDVYHIENYLLEVGVIREVVAALKPAEEVRESAISEQLEASARAVIPAQIAHRLRSYANSELIGTFDLGFSPTETNIPQALADAARRSMARATKSIEGKLTVAALEEREKELRSELEGSITTGQWRAKMPGRETLRRFVDLAQVPVSYEAFRNLILSKMVESGIKPGGMKKIVSAIVAD